MKKRISKIWGVGLVIVLLVSLLIAAAPAQARIPLIWETVVDAPSAAGKVLVPGLDILDISVGADGSTIYAVGTWAEGVTGTCTTNFTCGMADNVFTVTFVNQYGATGRSGTITLPDTANTTAPTSAVMVPAVASDLVNNVTGVGYAGGATAGVMQITGTGSGTDVGSYDVAGTWVGTGAIIGDPLRVYKSVDGGKKWSDLSAYPDTTYITNATHVAVAPDDVDLVVIADNVTLDVQVSEDGGQTWGSIGEPQNEDGSVTANAFYDLAVSAMVPPSKRFIACPGRGAANDNAAVYYFDLGAAAAAWRDATTDFDGNQLDPLGGEDIFWTIDFSPNFSADYTATALCEESNYSASGTGNLTLHALSFNQETWNAFNSDYPLVVETNDTGFMVQAADIAMVPDYVGSDDISRITFQGCSILDNEATQHQIGGIYRCDDSSLVTQLRIDAVNSVDFNGTDLVAGAYDNNEVYRSADALATIPTVYPSRTNKRIGVNDMGGGTTTDNFNDRTIVAWNPAGDEVIGVKMGAASCLSKSRDNGLSWNDISLIDSTISTITDVYITPDSGKTYAVAYDDAETSVYRGEMGAWEKVLCISGIGSNYLLRGTPADNDVIYVVESGTGARDIYYSPESGNNRWYLRAAPADITDLVAESTDVCYMAAGGQVYKSVNSGFTWDLPVTPELEGEEVNVMVSVAEDQIIVGGHGVAWSYSTDGGDTWGKDVPFTAPPAVGANPVQVTASGLNPGDYVYLISETAGQQVYRRTIGDPPPVPYSQLTTTEIESDDTPTGIQLLNGVLYISCDNGNSMSTTNPSKVIRCLDPERASGWKWSTMDMPVFTTIPFFAARTNLDPSPLKVTAAMQGNYIFVADGPNIRTYWDSLVTTGPELITPEDGYVDKVNPESGRGYPISFQWSKPSENTRGYALEIYTDPEGKNRAFTVLVNNTSEKVVVNVGPLGTVNFEFVTGATYYWRVRVSPETADSTAANGPIYSAWSEMRTFTVEPSRATVPEIASPVNGGTVTTTKPAFSWSPVVGATKYEFQLSEDTVFAAPLAKAELTETGVAPDVTLKVGQTYFWRVRAIAPILGGWSTIANFTVGVPVEAAPPPAPSAPPEVKVTVPEIEIPPITVPPAEVTVPPAAPAPAAISSGLLWAIIIIGAILVIALIVLIVRTRRVA